MKANRLELIEVLKKVNPALEKEDLVDLPPTFVFDKESVMSFNELMLVVCPFKSELDCTVPANELYKILDSISDKEVLLEHKKSQVVVKAGNLITRIKCFSNEEKIKEIKKVVSTDGRYKRLPVDFKEGVGLCIFSAGKDLSQVVLCCLYINKNKIVSSDGVRISEFVMSSAVNGSFLIPAKTAREIIKFRLRRYRVSKNMVQFKTRDGIIVSSILHEGDYYSTDEHFKMNGEVLKFPEKIKELLKPISVMVKEAKELDAEPQHIDVKVSKQEVVVSSSKDIGSATARFKVDLKLKRNKSFKINLDAFEKILERGREIKVGRTKALFETKKFRHLVALVR